MTGRRQSPGDHGAGYDPEGDPAVNIERQALKLAVQRPALCGPLFDALGDSAFTVPAHAATFRLIAACGGVAGARSGPEWAARLRAAAPSEAAREFVTGLAVESVEAPGADREPDARYADEVIARVEILAVSRQIAARQVAAAADEPGGRATGVTIACTAISSRWSSGARSSSRRGRGAVSRRRRPTTQLPGAPSPHDRGRLLAHATPKSTTIMGGAMIGAAHGSRYGSWV